MIYNNALFLQNSEEPFDRNFSISSSDAAAKARITTVSSDSLPCSPGMIMKNTYQMANTDEVVRPIGSGQPNSDANLKDDVSSGLNSIQGPNQKHGGSIDGNPVTPLVNQVLSNSSFLQDRNLIDNVTSPTPKSSRKTDLIAIRAAKRVNNVLNHKSQSRTKSVWAARLNTRPNPAINEISSIDNRCSNDDIGSNNNHDQVSILAQTLVQDQPEHLK